MYGDFPLENSVFLASLRFFFDAFLKEIALLQRRMIKNAPKARRKILGSRIPEFGQILEILASDLLSRGGLMSRGGLTGRIGTDGKGLQSKTRVSVHNFDHVWCDSELQNGCSENSLLEGVVH